MTYKGPKYNGLDPFVFSPRVLCNSLQFDGTGDVITINTFVNWMRNVNKGSIFVFVDWDVPTNEVDSLVFIDRGTAAASPRFEVDLSSFAPSGARVRTRRLDNDTEDFSTGADAVGSGFMSVCATVDWTAQEVRLYLNGVEDGSSPFTPGWASGNTSDTDPDSATMGGALNGIIHSVYTHHKVLPLTEIETIHNSRGASLPLNSLQSAHVFKEKTGTASGANSIIDISNQGRHGTPGGDPQYVESFIRRRAYG